MGWAQVDGRGSYYFAHSYAAETSARPPGPKGSSPKPGSARSSAASSTPRRAGRPVRATSRTRCAASASDPVPRRGGRPRRQGRALPGAARRRRSGRARRRRTRTPEPTSSSSSTSRRRSNRAARSSRSFARSRSGWRSRSPSGAAYVRSADGEALLAAGADKVAVNSAALERPALIGELAERSDRRRSSSRSTPREVEFARGRARAATGRAAVGVGARGRASGAQARSCSPRSTPTVERMRRRCPVPVLRRDYVLLNEAPATVRRQQGAGRLGDAQHQLLVPLPAHGHADAALLARCSPVRAAEFYRHLDDMWFHFGPALVASLVLLPIVVVDIIRLSNRFSAGPMVRMRRAMQNLAKGERVPPLQFRDNDFWKRTSPGLQRPAGPHREKMPPVRKSPETMMPAERATGGRRAGLGPAV